MSKSTATPAPHFKPARGLPTLDYYVRYGLRQSEAADYLFDLLRRTLAQSGKPSGAYVHISTLYATVGNEFFSTPEKFQTLLAWMLVKNRIDAIYREHPAEPETNDGDKICWIRPKTRETK